jgi:hypothetical protein
MPARLLRLILPGALGAVGALALPAAAQDDAPAADHSTAAMQLESWLQPQEEQREQAASGESFKTATTTIVPDPFAVLTSGALWEQTHGGIYTRDLGDAFSLSSQTTDEVFDENYAQVTREEKVGLGFNPAPEFSLTGEAHDSMTDAADPQDGWSTTGGGLAAESHLPGKSIMKVGLSFDRTISDEPASTASLSDTYSAEFQQPLGRLPLSANFKSQLDGVSTGNGPSTSMPSLEQSLVWKPMTDTTLQMGLRQQHYQEYPGVDNLMNEAIFADLSQKVWDNISWHSYAELLNTKGLTDQAPAAPIASGANGTPQATAPGSNASLTSSVPLSMEDQTLTFSTGPSVQLQKDLSASFEYSDRWDKNPAAGSTGQEQRVSVSVKGSF